jgi:creatinine amidohydrolase/Fe(II)-dependent formamide hydrolase-like protein
MKLLVLTLALAAGAADAAVLKVAELNTEQIHALDRTKTAVILPGGILEEHGPYLPSYADGYENERMARDLAETLGARPGWTALLFPPIPLGSGGANEIGGRFVFPGSYTVRSATVRAIFMDLATELGEQGFRWVFVVHGHGSPHHNRALDDASDFFRDTYRGQMVHLLGLMAFYAGCCDAGQRSATPQAVAEDGFSVHAGAGETSAVMFERPDLVPPAVRDAPAVTGRSFADLVTAARKPDWPGYFGAPRHASAARGAAQYEQEVAYLRGMAQKVLDGYDVRADPRYSDVALEDPAIAQVVEAALAHEAAQEARQQAWLRSRGKK